MNRVRSTYLSALGGALAVAGVLGVAFSGADNLAAAPFAQGTGTGTAMATGTMMGTGTAMATGTAMGTGTAMATGTAMGTGTAMATGTAMGTGTAMATGTAGRTGTAVATGTTMVTPVATLTPSSVITPGIAVATRFVTYYNAHDGIDLLGYAVSEELTITDTNTMTGTAVTTVQIPAQYFQKGRIEDQSVRGYTGEWQFTYGLLVPALIEKGSDSPVSNTTTSWAELKEMMGEGMVQPPAGFAGGVMESPDGRSTFIPMSPVLGVAPGYNVPDYFWDYMNSGIFPAGWLHDLGLPISADMETTVMRGTETRNIHMQAFERGVLTYDPLNPADYFTERGNIGYDYLVEFNVTPGAGATTTPGATGTAVATGTATTPNTPRATGTAVGTGTAVRTGTAVATGTAMMTTTAVTTGTAVATGTAMGTTTAGATRTTTAVATTTANPIATTSPVVTTTAP